MSSLSISGFVLTVVTFLVGVKAIVNAVHVNKELHGEEDEPRGKNRNSGNNHAAMPS
jgi:hypothetical protein